MPVGHTLWSERLGVGGQAQAAAWTATPWPTHTPAPTEAPPLAETSLPASTPLPAETEPPAPTATGAPVETSTAAPGVTGTDEPAPTRTPEPTPLSAATATGTAEPAPTETAMPASPEPAGAHLEAALTALGWADPAAPAPHGVRGEVCLANTGAQPAEGLVVTARVQFMVTGDAAVDLLDARQVVDAAGPLPPAARQCYPVDIPFTPLPDARYRLAVQATITNHAGWLPGGANCAGPALCSFGPELTADFELPASE
jgi:hypothetical protein